METKVDNTKTATAVTEKGYEGDLKHLMELQGEKGYSLSAPLFIMFAEYLGYVGKTLKWVDSWCVAMKKPEPWQQKFIETEAVAVLNEAKKKYPIKRMRELYDQLYEVILNVYDENLAKLEIPEE